MPFALYFPFYFAISPLFSFIHLYTLSSFLRTTLFLSLLQLCADRITYKTCYLLLYQFHSLLCSAHCCSRFVHLFSIQCLYVVDSFLLTIKYKRKHKRFDHFHSFWILHCVQIFVLLLHFACLCLPSCSPHGLFFDGIMHSSEIVDAFLLYISFSLFLYFLLYGLKMNEKKANIKYAFSNCTQQNYTSRAKWLLCVCVIFFWL